MQELVADASVHADAFGHFLHIRADLFAQRRDFVDEGNLRRKESIGGVFDHLCGFQIGGHNRKIAQEKRAVNLAHNLARAFGLHAHNNAVGPHEIVDRRAFAQEFGVGGHVELRVGVGLGHHLLDLAVGANRHGRLRHDHGVARHGLRNLFGGGHHKRQVRVPIAPARRRADGDEHRVGTINGRFEIGGERQAPGLNVLLHQRIKARLVNRHFTGLQHLDLLRVFVDADHVVAKIRETHTRNEADIAGANHRDTHGSYPFGKSRAISATVV